MREGGRMEGAYSLAYIACTSFFFSFFFFFFFFLFFFFFFQPSPFPYPSSQRDLEGVEKKKETEATGGREGGAGAAAGAGGRERKEGGKEEEEEGQASHVDPRLKVKDRSRRSHRGLAFAEAGTYVRMVSRRRRTRRCVFTLPPSLPPSLPLWVGFLFSLLSLPLCLPPLLSPSLVFVPLSHSLLSLPYFPCPLAALPPQASSAAIWAA